MKSLLLKFLTAGLAALLSLELALQLAAVVAPTLLLRGGPVRDGEAIQIMCVGDSHTYGAPLPREESYPAQLEVKLNELGSSRRIEVLNLGVPGMNSAQVANRLEQQLVSRQPQVLMVWIGINNSWNLAETETDRGGITGKAIHQALLNSKVYRLLAVLRHTSAEPDLGHETSVDQYGRFTLLEDSMKHWDSISDGRGPRSQDWREGLEQDYRRIASTAAAFETPVVFMTYPIDRSTVGRANFETANAAITTVAREFSVPLINTSTDSWRAWRDGYRNKDLIVNAAGPHPTGILYGYIVDSMVPVVRSLLSQQAQQDPDVSGDPTPPHGNLVAPASPQPRPDPD